eukprot:TRINITY_DN32148_c0_g1_i1.p1 TRINITY_DN32148_c0_g1~~TRINITY_DN32148_c0_g1_i1.p1  ORF type:complete len:441 (+),score=155.69 TRINITY_DN32148_c0_g1_i1:61-1383(+)
MAEHADPTVTLVVPDVGSVRATAQSLQLSSIAAGHLAEHGDVRWCTYDRTAARCRYADQCHFAHVADAARPALAEQLDRRRAEVKEQGSTASAAVTAGRGLPPGELKQVRVILVDPQDSRNVGAVARLCANYGVDDWWVVSRRQVDWDAKRSKRVAAREAKEAKDAEAEGEAEGAAAKAEGAETKAEGGADPAPAAPAEGSVPLSLPFWRYAEMLATADGVPLLHRARVVATLPEALRGCGTAVAFSGKQGDKYRKPTADIPRLQALCSSGGPSVALVFGNESLGLSSNDVLLCSQVCTLDTTTRCTSLNLSHAVGVVLSRIWETREAAAAAAAAAAAEDAAPAREAAADGEVGTILETCRAAMESLGYPTRPEQWGGAGRRRNKLSYRCHQHAAALLHIAQRAGATKEEVSSVTALIRLLSKRGDEKPAEEDGSDEGGD